MKITVGYYLAGLWMVCEVEDVEKHLVHSKLATPVRLVRRGDHASSYFQNPVGMWGDDLLRREW